MDMKLIWLRTNWEKWKWIDQQISKTFQIDRLTHICLAAFMIAFRWMHSKRLRHRIFLTFHNAENGFVRFGSLDFACKIIPAKISIRKCSLIFRWIWIWKGLIQIKFYTFPKRNAFWSLFGEMHQIYGHKYRCNKAFIWLFDECNSILFGMISALDRMRFMFQPDL